MFHAVEIDGEAYWDGGYMGNPALFPLIYNCKSTDIVIVHINPLFRKEVPRSADDILNRINEISFNSSLMREMRAVSFVTKLVTQKRIVGGELKHVLIHSIADDEFMGALSSTSKYNADWDFLIFLRDQGRKCADDWLAKNFAKLGVESSVDLEFGLISDIGMSRAGPHRVRPRPRATNVGSYPESRHQAKGSACP